MLLISALLISSELAIVLGREGQGMLLFNRCPFGELGSTLLVVLCSLNQKNRFDPQITKNTLLNRFTNVKAEIGISRRLDNSVYIISLIIYASLAFQKFARINVMVSNKQRADDIYPLCILYVSNTCVTAWAVPRNQFNII